MGYFFYNAGISDLPLLLSIDQMSCERERFAWQIVKREPLIRSFIEGSKNFSFTARADDRSIGAIMVRVASISDSVVLENTRNLLVPLIGPSTAFAEIFDLWVEPDFRRQGVARGLKLALESECLRRGIEWIFTFQHPDNSVAIRMNEFLGYEHIGSHTIYDTISRVCFLKRLSKA